jgi:hypothetical protein
MAVSQVSLVLTRSRPHEALEAFSPVTQLIGGAARASRHFFANPHRRSLPPQTRSGAIARPNLKSETQRK